MGQEIKMRKIGLKINSCDGNDQDQSQFVSIQISV